MTKRSLVPFNRKNRNCMMEHFRNSGILETICYVLLLFLISSCRKDDLTTTVSGFVYDTTDVLNIKPLAGARVEVGETGKGALPSSNQTYGATITDQNGYFSMSFESPKGLGVIPIRAAFAEMMLGSEQQQIRNGVENIKDLYLFKIPTILIVNFERVPPHGEYIIPFRLWPEWQYFDFIPNPKSAINTQKSRR